MKDNRSHLQSTEPPVFHFPKQILWLYEHDLNIENDKIEQLLDLDPTKLTEDLTKVLQDSVLRFDHFYENPFDESQTFFPIHAMLLLTALESEQTLPLILQILKQDQDYSYFWFGDLIPDLLENPFAKFGKNQPELIFEFLKLPNIPGIHTAYVDEAFVPLVADSPEKRTYFVEQYRQVLNIFITNAADEDYADSEAVAFIIADLSDLGYEELLPEIEQLYKLQLVDTWICGSFKEVETIIQKKPSRRKSSPSVKNIFDHYDELRSFVQEIDSPPTSDPGSEIQLEQFGRAFNEPIVKDPKIGRNDPCPCGSGKKHKKCCLNK